MENALISIIIPVYNVEKYLERCINSVINQTYKNIEIIIINDGSPDNSQLIIDEYIIKDKRILSFKQSNMGLSAARNTGLKHINGKYVYFLDSDDFINNDTIEELIKNIGNNDIVIANMIEIDEYGNIKYRNDINSKNIEEIELENSNFKFDYFFGEGYGTFACNKLYKIDFIKKINIEFQRNSDIYAEDLLFNLKCYINKPNIKVINYYTYYYYQNSNSITKSYKEDLTQRFYNLITDFYNYCIDNNKLAKNNDLISYTVGIAISNICKNSYNKYKSYKEIEYELKKFYNLFKNKKLVKFKYILQIKRKNWKYFYLIFFSFYKIKLFKICTFIQYIRFSLRNRK
jgi:glycosyltransferase involved in cell wall biosynthesis